jgi:hypothetical protein
MRSSKAWQAMARRFKIILYGSIIATAAIALAFRFSPPQLVSFLTEPKPLEATQRQFLFEVEHQVLVFNKHAFRPLAIAIEERRAQTINEALAPDLQGGILSTTVDESLTETWGEIQRRTKPEPCSGLALSEWFLAARAQFRQASVRFTIADLSPLDRQGNQSDWRGTGQLRVWGESVKGEVLEWLVAFEFQSKPPSKERLSRKGWLTLFKATQSQWSRSKSPLMREVTRDRGIDNALYYDNWSSDMVLGNATGGVYIADYDRDGRLDMLVTDYNRNVLYQGQAGGRFKDVTEQVGLGKTITGGMGATFVDFDGDGWLDLRIDVRVYRNLEGKRFVDMYDKTNLQISLGASGVSIADFDRDGQVDLYVTNYGNPESSDDAHRAWHDDLSGQPVSNYLWRNLGNWQFENVTASSQVGGGGLSSFASVWLDTNKDNWPDLYVINELGRGVLFVNQQNGVFASRNLTEGPGDHGSMGVTRGDVDGDGNDDLYVCSMYSKAGRRVIANLEPDTYDGLLLKKMQHSFAAGSRLYLNHGSHRFQRSGANGGIDAVGWSYGATLADLNNDGWLDLYACAGFVSRDREKPDG